MKQRDFTKGIEAVKAWCAEHDVTPSKLAIGLGRDPSSMRRLLKGQRAPSLEFALDIQRATRGDVPLTIWGLWTAVAGVIVRRGIREPHAAVGTAACAPAAASSDSDTNEEKAS